MLDFTYSESSYNVILVGTESMKSNIILSESVPEVGYVFWFAYSFGWRRGMNRIIHSFKNNSDCGIWHTCYRCHNNRIGFIVKHLSFIHQIFNDFVEVF